MLRRSSRDLCWLLIESTFHLNFCETGPLEVKTYLASTPTDQITLSIQITTRHLAQLDCSIVMTMNSLPEVRAVVMQQQQQNLNVLFTPDCWPKVKLQACFSRFWTGDPWLPRLSSSHVFSCLEWMLVSVSARSQTAASESYGGTFTEMFASTKSKSVYPWGAPNVTDQMWTEQYVNTKMTRTQLVPAWIKCLSCNKTNFLGFEQASCVFI